MYFNNQVIQHIKVLEIELVTNKFKRFINNASIEIDRR